MTFYVLRKCSKDHIRLWFPLIFWLFFNLNLLLEQRFVVTYVIPILDSLGFGLLVPFQNLFPCCLAATLITIINNSHMFEFFFPESLLSFYMLFCSHTVHNYTLFHHVLTVCEYWVVALVLPSLFSQAAIWAPGTRSSPRFRQAAIWAPGTRSSPRFCQAAIGAPTRRQIFANIVGRIWVILRCWGKLSLVEGRFSKWF